MDTEQELMVAVPAHPEADDQLILEARRQEDGLVLPVFSSVRALVAALGKSQPWAVLPLARARGIAAGATVRLAIDPEVSDAVWRWEPADLGGFSWRPPE
jgi:hypothetical protein